MPENEVADPPAETNPRNNEPPKETSAEPAKFPSVAAAYEEAMKKAKPDFSLAEPPKEDVKEPIKPDNEQDKAQKPEEPPKADEIKTETKSVLDTILEEPKHEEKAEPPKTEDVLKEFDDKKPNWSRAREVMKKQSTEIAELNQKLKAVPTEVKIPDDVQAKLSKFEETQQENARLKDAITAINVEYDPEFQEKYVKKPAELLNKAINRVKRYGGDADLFATALDMPEGKARTAMMKEAMLEVDEIDRPRVTALLDKIQEIEEERADLQKDPQQALERLSKNREADQQKILEETQRVNNAKFEKKIRELSDNLYLLRTAPPDNNGAEEWNERVKQSVEKAKRLLFSPGITFEEYADAITRGVTAETYQKFWLEEREARKKAEQELAGFDKSQPTVRGTSTPPSKPDDSDKSIGQKWQDEMDKKKQAAIDY